jgi:hypothetical protein
VDGAPAVSGTVGVGLYQLSSDSCKIAIVNRSEKAFEPFRIGNGIRVEGGDQWRRAFPNRKIPRGAESDVFRIPDPVDSVVPRSNGDGRSVVDDHDSGGFFGLREDPVEHGFEFG